MSDLNFAIADITADKQKQLDDAYRAHKKVAAASVNLDPNDPVGNSRVLKSAMKAAGTAPSPKGTHKLDKATREAFMQVRVDPKKEGAQKARLLSIYEGYYKREELKKYLPKKLNITLASSVNDMQAALAQVRQTMNALNAGANMRKVVPNIVDLLIRLLDKFDLLEQVGLKNAKGVDKALARALESPVMQTEMAEMEVEYGYLFTAGVEMRFMIKVWMFMKAYSDAKEASGRPAPAAARPPAQQQ